MSQQPDTRAVKEYLLGLQERICQRLEAVDGWVWDALAAAWDEGFGCLTAYVQAEGHALIPTSWRTSEGYRLGQWVSFQRSHQDSLSAERRQRLEGARGWVWDAPAAAWEDRHR